jgi:methylated-DNA-[protein]-cysteine S-methyltransferase
MKKFQKRVLEIVKKVPKGKVTTYKSIALKLNTIAYRAVGSALKNNKNPIVVPCHRVVNCDGKIGGYGGIKSNPKKIRLLSREEIKVKNNRIDLKRYLFSVK